MAHTNLDEKLINALLENSRESFQSLSDKLDVSVTTVSNHIHDLEAEGVINGYTPLIDYEALGYDVTAVINLKVEGSALSDITARLEAEPQIISAYETTGDFDVIAIGKFEDTDHMNDQIKTLLSEADIEESNTSVVLNTVAENKQFELPVEP